MGTVLLTHLQTSFGLEQFSHICIWLSYILNLLRSATFPVFPCLSSRGHYWKALATYLAGHPPFGLVSLHVSYQGSSMLTSFYSGIVFDNLVMVLSPDHKITVFLFVNNKYLVCGDTWDCKYLVCPQTFADNLNIHLWIWELLDWFSPGDFLFPSFFLHLLIRNLLYGRAGVSPLFTCKFWKLHLLISICSYGYLFYSMGYNSTLLFILLLPLLQL